MKTHYSGANGLDDGRAGDAAGLAGGESEARGLSRAKLWFGRAAHLRLRLLEEARVLRIALGDVTESSQRDAAAR